MVEQIDNPEQLKKNRKVILGIFGVPALVFVFSTLLYFMVKGGHIDLGTVNRGSLLAPPLEFVSLPLRHLDGQAFDFSKPDAKWAFVVFGDSECQLECEKMLYIARQSIVALAKKANRLRLMFITTDGFISEELQQHFDREYRGMDVLAIDQQSVQQLFAASGIRPFKPNTFYVVDPRGWLMMDYQVENTEQQTLNVLGKAVLADMKRLIK